MSGLFSFIALWKCKQVLGLNYNISFQLQYYLQVLPTHNTQPVHMQTLFFFFFSKWLIQYFSLTCVGGFNVHRKQGFQLQRIICKKCRWNCNQLSINALCMCVHICIYIYTQPLHPQGSYGHHMCNLLSAPHFCTDPQSQALWPRHPQSQIWRFSCQFSKDHLFSYLILQRLLTTRPPLRAFNTRLKPTQFIASIWQGLEGVWDISTPPQLSQRAAFY